jgi:hypothetical protein
MARTPVITNSVAAHVLGIPPQNLRRWVREGKFDGVGEVEWDKGPTFRKQRVFTREWLGKVATELGVEPDWSQLEDSDANGDSA